MEVTFYAYSRSLSNVILFNVTCYNVTSRRERKIDSQLGSLPMWSMQVLPRSFWAFSGFSGSLPLPKVVHIRLTGVSKLSQSEWLGVSVPCDGKAACPVLVPAFCLELLGKKLWPPVTLNWNKQGGKEWSYLLLFLFIKCSSHLCQFLIWEVFWVIIWKFGDVFLTRIRS